MHELRILDAASRDLSRLDRVIAVRILKRLQWLAENFGEARKEVLAAPLAGLFKFRVGDFRVIYELLPDEKILVIHKIGHRRDIYR